MKTVIVNGRTIPVQGNIRIFVDKLQLTRKAVVTWVDDNTCVIVDSGAQIDKPMHSLSSGYNTTIKEGK